MPHASHAMALQCSGFTINFRVPPLRWDVLRVSLLELSLELFELLELELRLLSSGFRVGDLLVEGLVSSGFRVGNLLGAADATFGVGSNSEEAAGGLFGNMFKEAASFGNIFELVEPDATSAVAERS